MTRILLFLLFFVMLTADTLDLNLSLAPGLSVKNAFLYLILVGIAIETALKRNRRIELMPVIVPYALCFFYAVFTIVVVVLLIDYPRYRLIQSIISLKGGLADNLLLLLVFFYGILNPKESLTLIKMMIWTVIVANLITVMDGLNLPDLALIEEREDGRIGGPIGESNQYAAFLALFLPASIALVFIERGVLRKLAILGFAVSLLALLMTVSRGGFLGVIAGAAVGAVFLRRYISARTAILSVGAMVFLAIAAVGILAVAGYGDVLYERTIGLSTERNTFDVSSGRNFIWSTALNKMFEQPVSLVTGYGWDTYRQFRVFRFAPHNTYLQLFFELGAIGLMLVLIAFANVFRTARKGLKNAEFETFAILFAFIFGLISILIAIFFVDIQSPWLFVWAYVGATMRLAVSQRGSVISKAEKKSVSGKVRRYAPGSARGA